MEIACILGNDFEDIEFRVPYDRLSAAGHRVTVIGEQKGVELTGKKNKEHLRADKGIDEAKVNQFDGLLIPGGYSPDHLRMDDRFVTFVRGFVQSGKPIFAVCHGPQLLISADAVRGRTMTAWPSVRIDLKNAGAKVVDREVVIDGGFITSRGPNDLEAFSQAILDHLGAGAAAHP